VVLGVAGCSGPVEDAAPGAAEAGPYAAEFEQAAVGASDFVRKVLADGTITPDEQRESQQKYFDCLVDNGLEASWDYSSGGRQYVRIDTHGDKDANGEISLPCTKAWVWEIDSLYWAVIDNPDKADPDDISAACLIREGLAQEGFTGKDFAELKELAGAKEIVVEGGDQPGTYSFPQNTGLTEDEVTLPSGVPLSDERVELCRYAPGSR
ncbi:MAG: hypothetical protein LBJ08_10875, partial [Bifidobacteriaceae bacterium]|nr:hypothetical protein [Bifidobacteriaceae bacterium]